MSGIFWKILRGISRGDELDLSCNSNEYYGILYKSIGRTLECVLTSCCLKLKENINIIGKDPLNNETQEYIFSFPNIHYFRGNKNGEFTIIMRRGSDLVKFIFQLDTHNMHTEASLSYNVTLTLRSLCNIYYQLPVKFYQYNEDLININNRRSKLKESKFQNKSEEEWKLISDNCICELASSLDLRDTIFSIKETSDKGNILFTNIVGDSILFLPKLTEKTIEFYGSDLVGERKRFKIFLTTEETDEVNSFTKELFDCIDQKNPDEKRRCTLDTSINDRNNNEIDYDMDLCETYDPSIDGFTWQKDEIMENEECFDKDYDYKHSKGRLSLDHKYMLVGRENTFVGRADRKSGKSEISVFRNIDDNSSYKTSRSSIINVSTISDINYNNFSLLPVNGQLHNCEKQMLFLSETDPNYVYQMDLENEKIIRRWDADGLPISSIGTCNKDAQSTPIPTFLGLSNNALFVMDSRIKDSSNRFTSKLYKSNVLFNSIATDIEGHILIGNDIGELRLFDGTVNRDGEFKKAKTLLNTYGSPIISVDVTRNGHWILATTKTCLDLYPVKEADSIDDRTGFTISLKNKPPAKKLRIKQEDLYIYGIDEVSFTPARFDQPLGTDRETKIITSTGFFVIVWDFEAIKRGDLNAYTIKQVDRRVEDCSTYIGKSDTVVLAYPEDIAIHKLNRKNKRTNILRK
ncbi:hypothetical protein cand_014240 [Cryptosporidium andersoni]|uniref:Vacuolar import/degradation Vid27 C-terminal domain-containing protein n=1 Tax=Cryptosporidium andersoni TaxID=117008 RepID=A0A1J4MU49_9CRYT|nr:hypothetical protein cand_014240 [Cryptosporidium andersoni]